MKRIISVLAAMAIMAVMLVAMAALAFADPGERRGEPRGGGGLVECPVDGDESVLVPCGGQGGGEGKGGQGGGGNTGAGGEGGGFGKGGGSGF